MREATVALLALRAMVRGRRGRQRWLVVQACVDGGGPLRHHRVDDGVLRFSFGVGITLKRPCTKYDVLVPIFIRCERFQGVCT